ncbi:family 20 glycosylhydrolase [Pedobacter caeni]|uniref:Hexosaminidase n=1 Tax=Pedobacter caeni TaxID=288992 RepID=A0A1M5A518_9SPHI|nr:family 20 glycosylhydrolase [Pedobacter caeni]SHF25314.1 hexosaminidase [Pedobacter caeni]
MRRKQALLAILLSFFYAGTTVAQSVDSLEFAKISKQISFSDTIKKGIVSFPVPKVPEGYELILKGTDRLHVINKKGKIFTPLQGVEVDLYYHLLRLKDQQQLDMPPVRVHVEGSFNEMKGNPRPFVIPALREWHGGTGSLKLTKNSRIVFSDTDPRLIEVAALLKKDLLISSGLDLKVNRGKPGAGDIFLAFNAKDEGLGEEGYLMEINDHVRLNAFHKRGMIWATRTILQLLEQDPSNHSLPKGQSRDYPKYEVRGLVLDVARKFFTMDFLRNYVKMMSYYKMSEFHIHLNDNGFPIYFNNNWDQVYAAFRLESSTYPQLTSKDGHYTKKEFIALQQLAEEYGVSIIPEIDVPAHSLAISRILPEIGSKKYGMDHLDLYHPKTYEIVSNIFKEYLQGPNPVFTGKVMHIGTDEYDKKEAEKFRYFTDYFIRYVQGFGKEARVWGALTHAKGNTPVTANNVTMNAWYNGYAEPLEMKKQGYQLISTPDGSLYIVPAAGYYYDYLNLKNLYRKWEPVNVGKVTFQAGDPVIRGGMFAVWNDKSPAGNGISEQDVHDRVFPAMQVLAQKMWAGTDSIPYTQFQAKSKEIKEGPGLNIAGFVKGRDSLVLHYDFNSSEINDRSVYKRGKAVLSSPRAGKGKSGKTLVLSASNRFVQLPLKEIGYNYTISLRLKSDADQKGEKVLFSSPHAVFKSADRDNKLAFSREGYDYQFDYQLPAGVWTEVAITGTNKGTSLFVNGKLKEKKTGKEVLYPETKAKMFKVETLVFPLQMLGDRNRAFQGEIDDLKVFNKVLSDQEIEIINQKPI